MGWINYFKNHFLELKKMRIYYLITISIIILVYSIFFIDKGLFKKLNMEDGLIEDLTALVE